jgi:hypothetical protein
MDLAALLLSRVRFAYTNAARNTGGAIGGLSRLQRGGAPQAVPSEPTYRACDPVEHPISGHAATGDELSPPEPKRELVLARHRRFPRGDALQDLARGLRGALATRPAADRVPTR